MSPPPRERRTTTTTTNARTFQPVIVFRGRCSRFMLFLTRSPCMRASSAHTRTHLRSELSHSDDDDDDDQSERLSMSLGGPSFCQLIRAGIVSGRPGFVWFMFWSRCVCVCMRVCAIFGAPNVNVGPAGSMCKAHGQSESDGCASRAESSRDRDGRAELPPRTRGRSGGGAARNHALAVFST